MGKRPTNTQRASNAKQATHHTEEHKRLGPIKNPKYGFNLRQRSLRWQPDEIYYGNPTHEAIYPEETLAATLLGPGIPGAAERTPFQPPIDGRASNWVLGHPFNSSGSDFDIYIEELCKLIKFYNRALYRLRKLHLESELNHAQMADLPDDPPMSITQAEDDYKLACKNLRKQLQKKSKGMRIVADCVEINGYIISVRVIYEIFTGETLQAKKKVLQPGGSSSSHISISSAFSSPR